MWILCPVLLLPARQSAAFWMTVLAWSLLMLALCCLLSDWMHLMREFGMSSCAQLISGSCQSHSVLLLLLPARQAERLRSRPACSTGSPAGALTIRY